MADKLDLKKQLKHLYQPPAGKVVLVDVPSMYFLMVDGEGDPNSAPSFQEAMQALYGVAYGIKFTIKKQELGPDYNVMAVEGLWWLRSGEEFNLSQKDKWLWTLMMMQPDHVTDDLFKQIRAEQLHKKGSQSLVEMRFQSFHEGLAAQTMHIGPYAEEQPTIEKIHRFIEQEGCQPRGKHHEIYLGDPRRTAPERLKTVLRQPVQ
jgi:hypothetical protein